MDLSLGQPLTTTRPDGLVTTNTYDSLGRVLTTTQSAAGFPSRTWLPGLPDEAQLLLSG